MTYKIKIDKDIEITVERNWHNNGGTFQFPYNWDLEKLINCNQINFKVDEDHLGIFSDYIGDNFITGGDLIWVANFKAITDMEMNSELENVFDDNCGYHETKVFDLSVIADGNHDSELKTVSEIFCSLEDYPLINEEIYSEIEDDAYSDSLTELKSDILKKITESMGKGFYLTEEESKEISEKIFNEDFMEKTYNDHYVSEIYVSIHFDIDQFIVEKQSEIKALRKRIMNKRSRRLEIYLFQLGIYGELEKEVTLLFNCGVRWKVNKKNVKETVLVCLKNRIKTDPKPKDIQNFFDISGDMKIKEIHDSCNGDYKIAIKKTSDYILSL